MAHISKCMLAFLCLCGVAVAAELRPLERLTFRGAIDGPGNISGVAQVRQLLALVSDEGISLDLLERVDAANYELSQSVPLLKRDDDDNPEIDLEGAAAADGFLYLVGSHSLTRKRIDLENDYRTNRKHLASVSAEEDRRDRDRLFRLEVADDGKIVEKKSINLRKLLRDDPILGPFCDLPSKENGFDVEGIAVQDHQLFVGFRGPVLRGNYVPVATLSFEEPQDYELRFVDLQGRGIRDLTQVKDGFLVIGGPVGDGDVSYRLYFWNGLDSVSGSGHPRAQLVALGDIPAGLGAKAEGITVLDETSERWRALIVYDGPHNGDPTVFEVPKPNTP